MRVIIESPYNAATPELIAKNVEYAWRCVKDSLARGEAPFASHLFYPNVLPETPKERAQGIDAGLLWGDAAELTAVYTDLGISPGMWVGIAAAGLMRRPIEYRSLK